MTRIAPRPAEPDASRTAGEIDVFVEEYVG
jgi:hypothetical protein